MSTNSKIVTGKKQAKSASRRQKVKPAVRTPDPQANKQEQILDLLRRKQGASLDELQKASSWQPHSVRGFLSGTVKKRLGLKLQSSKVKGGERRYAIAG